MEDFTDLEVIISLQENGPQYLDNLITSKGITSPILNLEKMYINNSDLFENGILNYINYIINNESQLCTHLIETFNDKEIIDYLTILIKCITKESFSEFDVLVFIQKLLKSNKIKKLMGKSLKCWGLIIGLGFHKIVIDNEGWENNVQSLQKIVKQLITNVDLKNNFVRWISHITNICISKVSMTFMTYNHNLPQDNYLANMLGMLLYFWDEIDNDKKEHVNYNYIISDKCEIKWQDKKIVEDTEYYNFITQCMFLILNTIRVGYIPTLSRSIKWPKKLNQEGQNMFNNKLIKECIETDLKVYKNKSLRTLINNFYFQIHSWIQLNKGKPLDDILYDYVAFMTDTYKENKLKCDIKLCEFMLDIIETNDFTSNVYIKHDLITLFSIKYLKLNSPKIIPKVKFDEIIQRFAPIIINFCNIIHNSQARIDFKLISKSNLYKIIDTYYITSEYKDSFIKILVDNKNMAKKLVNIVFTDLGELGDLINDMFGKIDDNSYNTSLENLIWTIFDLSKLYINIITFADPFIKLLEKDILMSKEIISTVIMIINLSIKHLSNIDYDDKLTLSSYGFDSKIIIDLEIHKKALIGILQTLYNLGINFKDVIEGNSFGLEYYEEFNDETKGAIENILNEIYIKQADIIETVEVEEEVPDEFMDPLTCILIENPCLLPGIDEFFDKSTIIKQLMTKNENPYTREKLDIEEFEEFNNLPQNKEKNSDFLSKINEWKNKKNIE